MNNFAHQETIPGDSSADSRDSISGIVDSIVYQNAENGYTVCEIEDQSGEPVTVVGIIPYLSEGDKITAYGTWTNHQTYGRQFKADSYDKTLPAEEGDILRYLSTGTVKGIGPKTAQRIVEQFGTDSFDVIENHPEWLCDIPGITAKKAEKISESYKSISGARSVMMFCRDYFTPQTSMKIYQKWGGSAVDRIRNNPYKLCEDFRGISFSRADRIAMGIGMAVDSEERIVHGLIYVLRQEAAKSGHTCIPDGDLLRCAVELLFGGDGTYAGKIAETLERAVSELKITPLTVDGVRYLFDPQMYRAEQYIAEKLNAIEARCPAMDVRDASRMIEVCESKSGIVYAPMQKKALLQALSDGVMILTGGPGTGKTTIIKGLISIFESLDYDVALAAPTGRAAKRMSEATSHEAKTIHRLLEMEFADESGGNFMRGENNTIEADVVIVDEASMIDVLLMEALLRAIKNGARMIIIGDSDQLPSVGAGNVLGDLISSGAFPVIRLTDIYRQSVESLIITNAHRINSGEMPETGGADSDFFFLKRETEEGISQTVIDLVKNRLPRSYGTDVIGRIQILTPSKKGLSGTDILNAGLQNALNPPSESKAERKCRDVVFRVGDRVMQTRNNYEIEWTTEDGREGLGVYNGDIGVVTGCDQDENLLEVAFDDRKCKLDSAMLDDIDHAYAITVHKSQGSEYPIVIIPLYQCAPMLLSRNLLYTAVTRASKMVILVGKQTVLAQMIANDRHAVRCTMLGYMLGKQ